MAGESASDKARRAREKAERLARYAEQWEKGAAGESRTALALGELPPDWVCWHDLKWPGRRYANIDHLVFGPGGVFVIDSKNWSGSVAVKEHVLRQNGYQRESAVAGCADSAIAVAELIPRHFDAVKPVMCFVRDDPIEGWARDVMLCSTANVVEMLLSRPTVLDSAAVADVARTLHSRMNSVPRAAAVAPASYRSRRVLGVAGPKQTEPIELPARHQRLARFFVGLGIWFCFMVLIGGLLSVDPEAADRWITPAALVAAFISWWLARRIVRYQP